MTRAYNVVDADGHILEPLDLWDRYMDPELRERRPRFVIDENGKERLSVEGKLLGNPRGIGSLGSVGVRQGIVKAGTLKYAEGRRGGFDPHARIVDMDADGIDAAFLYPSLGLFAGAVEDPALPPECAAPTTAGSPITVRRIPSACSGSRCCQCSRSIWRSTRCATPAKSSGCAAGSYGPTRITARR